MALAKKVQELARYRSDFFGKLREVLGARADFQVVGDRFVFASDVLFDSGSADLKPEATPQIDKLADALKQLETQIPADIAWVMQDRRPHRHQADHQRALPVELGAVVGPRHLGGALSDRQGHSGRTGWSPPASANSSRSMPATATKPWPRTAASS